MKSHHSVLLLVLILALPQVSFAVREVVPDEPTVSSRFTVDHTPPFSCRPYTELPVSARVISESPLEVNVALFFRSLGSTVGFYWREMPVVEYEVYSTSIPARTVGDLGVEYYIVARRGAGTVQAGRADSTFKVATDYAYEGDVPDLLPGDEFLEVYKPVSDPAESFRVAQGAEDRGLRGSTLSIQLLLVLIILIIGILIYQRLGQS